MDEKSALSDEKGEIVIRCERLNGQFELLRMLEPSGRVWALSCMTVLSAICLEEEDSQASFDHLVNVLTKHFLLCKDRKDSE